MKKKDLVFIGNISRDKIVCTDLIYRETWGGSALHSAISARKVTKTPISIFSAIGKDFSIRILAHNKIQFLGKQNLNRKCNTFLIDEVNETCINEAQTYVTHPIIPQEISGKHIHVSLRKGTYAEKILRHSKLMYETLSVDVMIHSVNDHVESLKRISKKASYLFCNSKEYPVIKGVISPQTHTFVTDGPHLLRYIHKKTMETFPIPKISKDSIISTTGAGDTFIGSLLGSYLEKRDLKQAISKGIHAGSSSLLRCGI